MKSQCICSTVVLVDGLILEILSCQDLLGFSLGRSQHMNVRRDEFSAAAGNPLTIVNPMDGGPTSVFLRTSCDTYTPPSVIISHTIAISGQHEAVHRGGAPSASIQKPCRHGPHTSVCCWVEAFASARAWGQQISRMKHMLVLKSTINLQTATIDA